MPVPDTRDRLRKGGELDVPHWNIKSGPFARPRTPNTSHPTPLPSAPSPEPKTSIGYRTGEPEAPYRRRPGRRAAARGVGPSVTCRRISEHRRRKHGCFTRIN